VIWAGIIALAAVCLLFVVYIAVQVDSHGDDDYI
jgi:hypothetical protein